METQKSEERSILTKEIPAKRVIVDIGSGSFPFPVGLQQRKFKKNEIYIGIEPSESELQIASVSLKSKVAIGEGKAHLIQARGERLPLANESANETVIINLLGDPRMARRSTRIREILKETHRILKGGGKLYIIETYSPHPNPQGIVELVKGLGFTLEKRLVLPSQTDPERGIVEKAITQFAYSTTLMDNSYLLQFIKVG